MKATWNSNDKCKLSSILESRIDDLQGSIDRRKLKFDGLRATHASLPWYRRVVGRAPFSGLMHEWSQEELDFYFDKANLSNLKRLHRSVMSSFDGGAGSVTLNQSELGLIERTSV